MPVPKDGPGLPRVPQNSAEPLGVLQEGSVRAACLQNETAPEKLLNRYEKTV